MRVLCSTGCFIGYRNRYDFRLLEYANKVLSCDGFEILLPFDNQDCIEVANYILNHAIFTPCVHADKRIGILISTGTNESIKKALDLFEDNCKFARYVGAEIVVLHLWGGKKSDSNIRQNILHFQDLKDIANQYGLIISVENVPCVVSDSLNCFEILRKKYNDIFFTFDSRFAAFQNIQQELFDNKSNNIFNYKFNNIIYKPKSAFKRYQNNIFDNFTSDDDDFFIKKNKNENNKDKNKVLKWNYSYYRNNHKYVFKKNYSIKKERIKKLFKLKHPDIIDDWQKPKIIKILEKNTLIEDAIITRPWKFFPCFDNNCS